MGFTVARFLVNLVVRLITRVKVEGREKLPASGGYVVASNHLGRLDAPLTYCLINNRNITMLVAEKYHKYVILRWFVKQLEGIWVDRFNADMRAMRIALNRLKAGDILVMAPEGTRSQDGSLALARPGASYLAVRAGVPVVPAALIGSEDRRVIECLRHFRRVDVTVRIGDPIVFPPLKGKGREAALQAYTDEIMCRIAALLPESARGAYANHPRLRELLEEG